MSTLDLSGADTRGFPPIPSGTYAAEIHEAAMQETKGGPTAKYPAGTPKVNVQFRITQEYAADGTTKVLNRRVFSGYVLPPEESLKNDPEGKAARTLGMFVRLLIAAGFEEKDVKSKKFHFDVNDLTNRELMVVVGQKPKFGGEEGEMDNEVKGVKPMTEGAGTSANDGLL